MRFLFAMLLLLLGPALPAGAARETVCPHLEAQALIHDLPGIFFVRLIWKESRFNPGAVSPKGAQGIAQFMPGTAAERGLADPFDAPEAIAESARFLRDLVKEFGNPGLAAAAYNAGPQRVRDWLAGRGGLPWETRNFVISITGLSADQWRLPETKLPDELQGSPSALRDSCLKLASRAVAPAPLPATGDRRPWGVQLAADFSRDRALVRFSRLRTRYASILGALEPSVVPERNLSIGRRTRYGVQIGADSREEAAALCARLRGIGGACMVTKN